MALFGHFSDCGVGIEVFTVCSVFELPLVRCVLREHGHIVHIYPPCSDLVLPLALFIYTPRLITSEANTLTPTTFIDIAVPSISTPADSDTNPDPSRLVIRVHYRVRTGLHVYHQ
jgi:hypothetical protein